MMGGFSRADLSRELQEPTTWKSSARLQDPAIAIGNGGLRFVATCATALIIVMSRIAVCFLFGPAAACGVQHSTRSSKRQTAVLLRSASSYDVTEKSVGRN